MKKYFSKILFAVLVTSLMLLTSPTLLLAQGEQVAAPIPTAGTEATSETATAPDADKTAPSDVENVKALPGDKEVTLTWDISTDNVGVTGYKIYYGATSVKTDGGEYEVQPVTVEDVVTHTITNLENGKTYYFALTAMDAAGNESVNYSYEVSAKPEEGLRSAAIEDDGKNPEVVKAETEAPDIVKVEFSEPIILPVEDPEKAFEIKPSLRVKEAELDPQDEFGKTVMLLTEAQTAGTEYEITVGVEVEDHFGNAVSPGSDQEHKKNKIKFTGFGTVAGGTEGAETEEEPEAPKDTAAPAVSEIKVPVSNQIQVVFSEPIQFGRDAKTHFSISEKASGDKLKIINVSLSTDRKTAFVNTESQKAGKYEIRVSGVTDETGNEIETDTLSFDGRGSGLEDLVPPEDVTNLVARFARGKKFAIELTWKKSKDSAGDLADQLVAHSTDKGETYGSEKSLGESIETTVVENLTGGKEYTFKITPKDETGNKSLGKTVSLFLPETGPALPVAVVASLLAGYFHKRRRKKMEMLNEFTKIS